MSRGSPHDGLDSRDQLAREMRQFAGLGASLFQAAAARVGMTVTDLQVIELLESDGPATAGQLADRTGLTTGAITAMLNRLEEAGLVQRERDPDDGRRVIVQLASNEDARQKIGDLFAAMGSAWDAVISGYDTEQIAFLSDFLTRGNEHARNEILRLREAPEGAGGTASAPLEGLEHGRLMVNAGLAKLTVRAGDTTGELYQARFEGQAPEVRAEGGTVTIRYPRSLLGLGAKTRAAQVTLNASIPWEITIQGKAADVTAELGGLDLAGLEVKGGYSMLRVELPVPTGTVPVRLGGAALDIKVHRPAEVAARVHLKGWVSTFVFDDNAFNNFGNNERMQSHGYATAEQRYDIEVASSASSVRITAG